MSQMESLLTRHSRCARMGADKRTNGDCPLRGLDQACLSVALSIAVIALIALIAQGRREARHPGCRWQQRYR